MKKRPAVKISLSLREDENGRQVRMGGPFAFLLFYIGIFERELSDRWESNPRLQLGRLG
jgi:hypothetical protein